MRPSRLLFAALVAGTAVTASACASPSSTGPDPAPTHSAASAQPPASTPSTVKATAAATAKDKTAAAPCETEDLTASITAQEPVNSSGVHHGMMMFSNNRSTPCLLDGWVAISLTNAHGDVVKVPTTTVDQPGAPTATTLRAGYNAWAGIKWVGCDKGDESCPTGNALIFKASKSGLHKGMQLLDFPAPERSDITMKSLTIGSVQPSRQGVVAW